MDDASSARDLLRQVRECAGQSYLNRAHQRGFSLNVFQMNAIALIEAVQRVEDPDQGLALMMENNRAAGRQAHREISRHVHNFVSSALTLVEHTRVFIRKNYKDSPIFVEYDKHVQSVFSSSPVSQFVQGLRNYMLHRGLPNSTMFLHFSQDPDNESAGAQTKTGIRYDTASLLDWNDWKPLARTYIEGAGEHLDIGEFVQEYLTIVNQFHRWLDTVLATHHQSDLIELSELQTQLAAVSPAPAFNAPVPVETPDAAPVALFGFTLHQTTILNEVATELVGKIRELRFAEQSQGFPTERPTTPITDKDLLGPVTFWGADVSGQLAFSFILQEGKTYGLSEDDFKGIDHLVDTLSKRLGRARA
jgi:hypothetical protein